MKNKGFTLVEILVALALAGLVMTAVYSTYMIQHKAYVVQDQVAAIQQNLRAAMYMMELDFRMAGYDPEGKANSGLIVDATDDDATDEDSISFTYVAEDDGVTEDTIIYRLYDAYGDGDVDLGRQIFRSGTPPRFHRSNRWLKRSMPSISFTTMAPATRSTSPPEETLATSGSSR